MNPTISERKLPNFTLPLIPLGEAVVEKKGISVATMYFKVLIFYDNLFITKILQPNIYMPAYNKKT